MTKKSPHELEREANELLARAYLRETKSANPRITGNERFGYRVHVKTQDSPWFPLYYKDCYGKVSEIFPTREAAETTIKKLKKLKSRASRKPAK